MAEENPVAKCPPALGKVYQEEQASSQMLKRDTAPQGGIPSSTLTLEERRTSRAMVLDAMADFLGISLPPPLDISNATNISTGSTSTRSSRPPGAYSVQGSNDVQRRPSLENYDSLYYDQNHHPAQPSPVVASSRPPGPPGHPQHDAVIGGAVLVEDSLEQGHATPASADRGQLHHHGSSARDVVEGKVLQPRQGTCRSSKPLWWVLSALVLVVIVSAILLAVLLRSSVSGGGSNGTGINGGNDNSSMQVLQEPILYPPFALNDTIPPSVAASIQEVGSAHYQANRWMLADPYLDTYPLQRQWQRFFMVVFYYVTGGDQWYRNDHWLSHNVSECHWYSSHRNNSGSNLDTPEGELSQSNICDKEDNRLLVLNVTNNNLHGTFPRMTHFITSIQHYDMSHNRLGGALPIMADLPDMLSFFVHENDFDGMLVGKFTSYLLRDIKTYGNRLQGATPGVYQYITELEHFDNSDNLYYGPLVSEIGSCTKLRILKQAQNRFFGSIPTEIGALTLLQEYNVSGNLHVNGTIPSELGLLTQLEMFDISNTNISGKIPGPLCDRSRNGSLDIYANCSRVQCCS